MQGSHRPKRRRSLKGALLTGSAIVMVAGAAGVPAWTLAAAVFGATLVTLLDPR